MMILSPFMFAMTSIRKGLYRDHPDLDDDLAAYFRAQQLRALAKHGVMTLPGQLLLGAALMVMLHEQHPVFCILWSALLLLMCCSAALRMRLFYGVEKATLLNFRWAEFNIVVGGLVWCAIPIVSIPHATPDERMVLFLAMTCIITTSSVVFQNLPFAAVTCTLTTICATVGSIGMFASEYFAEIAIFSVILSAFLVRNIFMASAVFFERWTMAQTARELSQSLAKQAKIIQNTSNAVFLLDKTGRITWVNKAFEIQFGYSEFEVVGALVSGWLSKEAMVAMTRTLWPSLLRLQQGSIELQVVCKGGQPCWRRFDIKRLVSKGNKAEGYIVFAIDLSEIKQATDALHAEQNRLNHIIDGTHCGTWEIDVDGGVCKLGGHWFDIIGVDTTTPLVAEGAYILDRIHPDDLAGQRLAFRNYLQGKVSQYVHEHRLRHEDGTWHWVAARGKASAYTDDGKIEQMSGTAMDISQSKATEQALMEASSQANQASQAKSLFLATMSHEIRTPMNGVIGTAEWLKLTKLDEEQRDGIQTIVESGRSLLSIIDDVLDFSKIDAGRMKLEETVVSLAELTQGVADAIAPIACAKHADLHVFIDPRLPSHVMGDAVRLRQVLFNLSSNAIKFCGGTEQRVGQVDIQILAADDESSSWQIVISDDGIGMTPETLSRLFTPFTQADAATTRRFGGTGLGLAICHQIVELMGGGIVVHSLPDHGTTFIVTLPLLGPEEAVVLPAPIDLSDIDCLLLPGRNYRSDSIAAYLEHAGARVHSCYDVSDALAMADKMRASVLVRDTPDGDQDVVQFPDQVRHLLIGRYQHGPVRIVSPTVAQLGRAHVDDVLRAVAVLAGRRSPEVVHGKCDEMCGNCTRELQATCPSVVSDVLILIAEDDPTNQKVIKRQMKMIGYACEVASDGQEALTLWRTGRFDMLLSDLHMPLLDGYELAQKIREDETQRGQPRAPILALTANALQGEETRAIACGMDAYLTKPIAIKELRSSLLQWLPTLPYIKIETYPAEMPAIAAELEPASCIDLNVLRALVGDDEAIIRELLHEFDTSSSALGLSLRHAVETMANDQVCDIVHQLKSAAKSVGAMRLSQLCEAAENSARSRQALAVPVDELLLELNDVHALLATLN